VPTVLHGRDVARRAIELYWPQSIGYEAPPWTGRGVMSQSRQNDIPKKLAAFRAKHHLGEGATLDQAEKATGWGRLQADLTAVVIGMPLAKLQRFGDGHKAVEHRFLCDFPWQEEVRRRAVKRAGFDDQLHLLPVSASGWSG
jgi:hypothetical protein